MSIASTAKEVLTAAELLAPVIDEVSHWLAGRGHEEPLVLSQLPVELRSQAALARAKARSAAGSSPPAGARTVPGSGV